MKILYFKTSSLSTKSYSSHLNANQTNETRQNEISSARMFVHTLHLYVNVNQTIEVWKKKFE